MMKCDEWLLIMLSEPETCMLYVPVLFACHACFLSEPLAFAFMRCIQLLNICCPFFCCPVLYYHIAILLAMHDSLCIMLWLFHCPCYPVLNKWIHPVSDPLNNSPPLDWMCLHCLAIADDDFEMLHDVCDLMWISCIAWWWNVMLYVYCDDVKNLVMY